jgi:hypothetical protein
MSGLVEPLRGREAFHPVHASGLLAPVILGDASNGDQSGRPGLHQEALKAVDCLDVPTLRGSVDALLELEDGAFGFLPGDVFPFIH